MNTLNKDQLRNAKNKFEAQRNNAVNVRGLVWQLSFKQWLKFWAVSGSVVRHGNKGPYCVSNIKRGQKGSL